MWLGNEPAAISIRQVPWNIIFKHTGLFAFLQKKRYIFMFNLAVASLGLPLPLRRPPRRNSRTPEVPLI